MADARRCYWCAQPETSREHVPPRCIFPEGKDTADGKGYRDNPITVPSCDAHNAAKSGDDEYLLQVIALSVANNPVGGQQAATKVFRAFQRFPGKAKQIFADRQNIYIKDATTDKVEQTIAVNVDLDRLKTAFEHIVRAIYFHHLGKQLAGAVTVWPEFLVSLGVPGALERNELFESGRKDSSQLFEKAERYGAHPDVFYYQMVQAENSAKLFVMRLSFYEGSRVSAIIKLD